MTTLLCLFFLNGYQSRLYFGVSGESPIYVRSNLGHSNYTLNRGIKCNYNEGISKNVHCDSQSDGREQPNEEVSCTYPCQPKPDASTPKEIAGECKCHPNLYFVSQFHIVCFFDFMRIPEVREFEFQLFLFPCFSHIRHFFYVSFRRVGRFRFSGVKR